MTPLDCFHEIWLVDFEFQQPTGGRPSPLCMVAPSSQRETGSALGGPIAIAPRAAFFHRSRFPLCGLLRLCGTWLFP